MTMTTPTTTTVEPYPPAPEIPPRAHHHQYNPSYPPPPQYHHASHQHQRQPYDTTNTSTHARPNTINPSLLPLPLFSLAPTNTNTKPSTIRSFSQPFPPPSSRTYRQPHTSKTPSIEFVSLEDCDPGLHRIRTFESDDDEEKHLYPRGMRPTTPVPLLPREEELRRVRKRFRRLIRIYQVLTAGFLVASLYLGICVVGYKTGGVGF